MKKLGEKDERDFVQGLMSEEKSMAMMEARIDHIIEFLMRVKSRL
jgi:hypothetical protein